MEKKITKKEYYEAIRTMVETVETVGDIPSAEVLDFIDKMVAQIDAKASKAKEKAAEKKADGDELREAIKSVLTADLQAIDSIVEQVGREDVTKNMVTARLTQLVKMDVARKEQIKEEGSNRKVMAYALKEEEDTTAAEEVTE